MSSREAPHIRVPEVSALFLFRIFVGEYWYVFFAVALLIALSAHVIFRSPEMLLNVLVFVILWLQLELSYRQWWLESKHRRPILRVVHVEADKMGRELIFHVENIGLATARGIYIDPVTVSRKVFENYRGVLLLKGYLFKKIEFVGCGVGFGRGVRLRPYGVDYVKVDCPQLTRCAEDEDEVLFFLICYDEPIELGVEVCSEAVNLEVLCESSLIYSVKLDYEPPPGVLTKIPYMLRDALMYWRMYKADKRRRRQPRDRL